MPRNYIITVSVIIASTLLACGLSAPIATPDTQATVNAAVAATTTGQAANQAAINAAVQATTTAQATMQVTATATKVIVASTPTVTPAETSSAQYVIMTEEELAALINQTVTAAIAANTQYAATTTTATADNTITSAEAEAIAAEVAQAEALVAQAEEQVAAYTELYSAAATETIAALEEINQSLNALNESIAVMNQTLAEINTSLAQGMALAEETINQLESAAQTAQTKTAQLQTQAQNLANIRPAGQPKPAWPTVAPSQVAGNPLAAAETALSFVEAGRQALADGQLSPDETANLAQQAANAQASFTAQNNPQLAGMVNTITNQLAQGNLTQAQAALNQLSADTTLTLPPAEVAADLPGAAQMALNFAQSGRESLADGAVSSAELVNLAQQSANVKASLAAHGGPQGPELAGLVNDITGQLARGDIGQAQESLNKFDRSIGSLPRPEKPAIDKPVLPKPTLPKIRK